MHVKEYTLRVGVWGIERIHVSGASLPSNSANDSATLCQVKPSVIMEIDPGTCLTMWPSFKWKEDT